MERPPAHRSPRRPRAASAAARCCPHRWCAILLRRRRRSRTYAEPPALRSRPWPIRRGRARAVASAVPDRPRAALRQELERAPPRAPVPRAAPRRATRSRSTPSGRGQGSSRPACYATDQAHASAPEIVTTARANVARLPTPSPQLPLRPVRLGLRRQQSEPALHLVRARRGVAGPVVVEVAEHLAHPGQRGLQVALPGVERVRAIDLDPVVAQALAAGAEPAQ